MAKDKKASDKKSAPKKVSNKRPITEDESDPILFGETTPDGLKITPKVEGEKRPDPTKPTIKRVVPIVVRTPSTDVTVTTTSSDSQPTVPVIECGVENPLETGSVANPECEGYAPNLATGVCRCKSCRSKPHGGRTRRPFYSAQSVPPTTPIAPKESVPIKGTSAGLSQTKGKGLMAKTKGLSSSSQGSADMGKTTEGDYKHKLVVKPYHLVTKIANVNGFGVTDGKKWNITCFSTREAAQRFIDIGGEWDEMKVRVNVGYPYPMIPEKRVEGKQSSDPGMASNGQRITHLEGEKCRPPSMTEKDILGVNSVASASTLPVQSSLEGKQVMASVRPTVSAVTVDTSGKSELVSVSPDVGRRFLEENGERPGPGNIMPRREWSGTGVNPQNVKKSVLPDTPFGGSTSAPHLEVRAYAGTGKSTTVVQGLIKVKGGTPKISPSDEQAAVWEKLEIGKNDTVRVSAFSNAISNEMGQKIHDAGLNGKGVEATGIHKLGFAAVRAQFGYLPPNGYAVTDLVCKKLGGEFRDLKAQKGMLVKINATADLVSLCKQTMTAPTEAGLEQLSYRYDVELDDQRASVFQLVPDVLEACKKPQGKIAFDDMIWLPLVLGLHVPKVDHQIIDESQDLNRMQQELMYLAGHRVTFVGDEHQAIMGFAGADSESMKRMYKTLAGSGLGCDRLPLTVTRRCGKAIVKEAQKYVPGFRAHDSNGEGLVRHAAWTWKGTGPDRVLVPWEKTYGPLVQDGAMVVCRTNAPTVSECFRFLARGIKAVVLGRKVGQGLIDLIKKAEKGRDGIGEDAPIAKLISWLSDWLTTETAKEQAKKFPSEGKIQNLEDKYECLVTFAKSDCARTSEVITRINTVFADKKCPRCGKPYDVDARVCDAPACGGVSLVLPGGVKFSSIHKSKGLEAKQVIYLCPPGTGMREEKMQAWELEQENNLRYVAVTRAISELIYVQ